MKGKKIRKKNSPPPPPPPPPKKKRKEEEEEEKKDQKKEEGGTKTTERKQVFVVLNWKREGLQKMKVFGGPSEILVLYLSSMCDARHSSVH